MKGRKRRITGGLVVLVAALIGALVLTACAPSGNGGNGENGYEPPPRPWIVRYGHTGGGMSGYLGIDPMAGGEMLQSLSGDILAGFDMETHEPILYLATRVEFNREELYTDYWIREGIPFHNGDIMTAEDVAFSYNRLQDPDDVGVEVSIVWSIYIDKTEVIDDNQIRIYWDEMGSPVRTVNPFQPVIVPKNYIEEVGLEAWADSPVLTGPMKVVDWERDVYVHLDKAFPEEGHWYWGDAPNYDELIIEVVPETATRLAKLKAGELDIASLGPAAIPEVIADPNLTLAMEQYTSTWSILFCDYDSSGSPLSDPLVREAVSLAIDREGIAENVLNGAAEPWGSYYPPDMIGYEYREPDPYDPDEARRLLEEAGYPDGFVTFFHYPMHEEVAAQAVIASLREVGIRAEAQSYEWLTWIEKYSNDQFTGMSWAPVPMWVEPYYPDRVFNDSELMGLGAPISGDIAEVREAFDQIMAAGNEEEMAAAAQAGAELVLDELGYRTILWAMNSVYAYGPKIEEWDPLFPVLAATYKE